jgi:hypothetical protein
MIEQKGWSDGMLSMPVFLEVFLGWGVMVMRCGEEDDSYTQCSYLSIYLVQSFISLHNTILHMSPSMVHPRRRGSGLLPSAHCTPE